MDQQRIRDEWERIRLHGKVERERSLVAAYEANLAYFRRAIEEKVYRIGRLDERLG